VDNRVRALSILDSLQETLDDDDAHFTVSLDFLDRFHHALDLLESTGEDMALFRVPDHVVVRAIPGRTNVTPHVLRESFIQRVREVRSYFRIRGAVLERAAELGERPERLIGFEAPAVV